MYEPPTLRDPDPETEVTELQHAVSAPRRFQLGALIGRGGMGEVRLARDPRIGREVAVKTIRGHVHSTAVARFVREARVQGRLDHPAIVPVYDLEIDEHGMPYFAMKRLTGTTLAEVLLSQSCGDTGMLARWSRRTLLARLVDVCQAIEFAHARGVIHRDLKPHNIMLGDFGEVYVLDWGIARVLSEELDTPPRDAPSTFDSIDDVVHTVAGASVGTPGYMPPEQVEGRPVDGRADVFALGCILFEILTGEPALPRGPDAFRATLDAAFHSPRARRPELDLPPELDELCVRATANAAAERLASPGALAEGIQRYLDGDRDVARRRQLANEYAAAATRTLTSGDRAVAMREAGRALALDPGHAQAQALVGHLLLTPAKLAPPEVEHALAAENLRTGRVQLRMAILVYAMFLVAMPVVFWLGVRGQASVIALIGGIAANLVASTYALVRNRMAGRWLTIGLALHTGTLALAGFVFGPLLVVPTLVVGSVAAYLTQPVFTRKAPVIVSHALAAFAPIALELAGVVPRTFSFDGGALRIQPWAVDIAPRVLVIVLITATALQIIATSILIGQLRHAKDAAERANQLQLWHLRQLVPPQPGDRVTSAR